ncbi:radical SAM protein [Effusibacillus dendaii]|uniref:Radical SAM protein n=2 Tax=Effusibacillus dendaii TaxID=2743772 RepID=A0A7I8D9A2_9BACL|nr:radical SAM protein [Effusibacillus dendaii]
MKSKTVLNRVTTPVMPFVWSINPYRGCAHGCAFCYARGTHSYIGMRADDTFRTHLFVKEDAPAVLRRELSKGKWKGGSVAIGTATDPYQPLEKQQRITRGILEVLALYRIPATVTTRSPLVLRDIDLLQELNRYTRCSVNISVNTLDVNVWRAIEPESPHPKERFDTVGKLRAAGIDTGVFIAPVLPFLTDEQTVLESLLQSARKADASFISVSLLRLKPEVKTWFFAQLQNCFPDRVPLYRSLYAGTYVDERYAKSFREKLNPLLEQYGYGKTQLSAAAHDESDFLSDTRSPEQLSFAL